MGMQAAQTIDECDADGICWRVLRLSKSSGLCKRCIESFGVSLDERQERATVRLSLEHRHHLLADAFRVHEYPRKA